MGKVLNPERWGLHCFFSHLKMGFSLGLERGNMSFISGTYQHVKERFERSAQAGFRHIDIIITSPEFFKEYLKDPNKSPGGVIRLKPVKAEFQKIELIEKGLKGYPTVISEGFQDEYAVAFLVHTYENSEESLTLLNANVTKHYYSS